MVDILRGILDTEYDPAALKMYNDPTYGMRLGTPLLCPEHGCSFNYLHPVAVEVNAGGSITTVTDGGTVMTTGEPTGRGVTITIKFTCEQSCTVQQVFQFHKGMTFSRVESSDHQTFNVENPPEGMKIPYVIWRD